jgi:carbon-monoxide dehydrogenase medium subunit
VKPAAFDYVVPRTVPEAIDALGDTVRKAQVLADGQSLILEMHLQRIRPDLVVDINRIAALDDMRVNDDTLQVGALIRHRVFESPQAVPGPLGTLFSLAVVNIAHLPSALVELWWAASPGRTRPPNSVPSPQPWMPTHVAGSQRRVRRP